jgi:CheY-like chemotaxis protein
LDKSCKQVLIVDDDELLRGLLRLMLSDHTVIEADNGKTAVELFKMLNPDIVLMDTVMPVMDGVSATREILKENPDAIVLAITASAPMKGKDMLDAGAREIVCKPITKRGLNELLKKY